MIYFIENAGSIKVGYAADVSKRFTALRAGHPSMALLGTMEGNRRHERAIHALLADFHESGEWFRDCTDVRAIIRDIQNNGIAEAPPTRSSKHVPTEWDHKALELVAIITNGKSVDDLPALSSGLGLEPNFLWRMKYRQGREVSAGEYYGLMRAASKVIEIRRAALERQADFVRSLELDDAEKDNRLFDAERGYRAAKALMGGQDLET